MASNTFWRIALKVLMADNHNVDSVAVAQWTVGARLFACFHADALFQ
jgi:hypothetical protein